MQKTLRMVAAALSLGASGLATAGTVVISEQTYNQDRQHGQCQQGHITRGIVEPELK